MILWILFACLLYGLTLFENGPNTDALTARIDVKNVTIPDTYEIPKVKAVPQAPSQEPPPLAAPEQYSDSEDEEPSESIAQHLKPTPLSPPPSPIPVTTKQYPLRNRHTLHPFSQLTYATVGVPSYQPAIRVIHAVVPSPLVIRYPHDMHS